MKQLIVNFCRENIEMHVEQAMLEACNQFDVEPGDMSPVKEGQVNALKEDLAQLIANHINETLNK